MNESLVKYKANVWGISRKRTREILKQYADRKFDSPGAFKRVEIGGNGNGNRDQNQRIEL